MITETPEGQFQASCDIDGLILDPGAADAPMGGYPTREAAQKAADAHDWFTASTGVQFCKSCAAALEAEIAEWSGRALGDRCIQCGWSTSHGECDQCGRIDYNHECDGCTWHDEVRP